MAANDAQNETRDEHGRFLPGTSGNPGGRNPRLHALREMLASRSAEVIESVLFFAIQGDMQAARLVLERVVPPLRGSNQLLELPELASAQTVQARCDAIVQAVATGRLPADIAQTLLTALASVAQLTELEELKARLAALEAKELIE